MRLLADFVRLLVSLLRSERGVRANRFDLRMHVALDRVQLLDDGSVDARLLQA